MSERRCRLGIVGGLRRDYYITAEGSTFLGIPGGHGLYAAAGARVWCDELALYARIGPGIPLTDLADLERAGIHPTSPSRRFEEPDPRRFFAYLTPEHRQGSNPAGHFLRIGRPLPKDLLDYPSPVDEGRSGILGGPDTFLPDDLPSEAISDGCFHLCPADYRTHLLLPPHLRAHGARRITLDPAPGYDGPHYASAMREILSGLDAFLPSAEEAREILRPKEMGPFEAAEALAAMGCDAIAIKYGPGGSCVWDRRLGRGWHVPAYPARATDITGAGDAYAGGFLAGLAQDEGVLEAALKGTVSASLAIEGSGAFYPLGALPGLARARLEALRPLVRPA